MRGCLRVTTVLLCGLLMASTFSVTSAFGQDLRRFPRPSPKPYHPFNAKLPVGVNALLATQVNPPCPGDFQFVQFVVEGGARSRVFARGPAEPVPTSEDGRIGLAVGYTYRVVLSELTNFPGVELYPSVEVLGRTAPPPGREADFPAPVRFTTEEIEIALSGRLVTKVLHLETPQFAAPAIEPGKFEVADFPPRANLLAEAELRGRPIAIVRIGGRTPDPNYPEPTFYGPGGPIWPAANHTGGPPVGIAPPHLPK
ncbi:hypothetical protein Pan189_13800 [Stratiformator vulcanicus]|uniref:Uncharacterized protein n=2 Tax=Stratiformator vulcanicus TaxID=2527980 RepID=A0A517QZI1_9PLAN|nr:hypothetical protein Pan189_13800 [Stratiformator vulcanicus]